MGCPSRNMRGEPCASPIPGRHGYCLFHGPEARRPGVLPPDPGPPPRPLPRLPSETEVIERLRAWAEEFDALDLDRYRAVDFIEWVELELTVKVQRQRRPVNPIPAAMTYPVWSEAARAAVG